MSKLAPYTDLVSRRRALGLFGATATLLGCGGGSGSSDHEHCGVSEWRDDRRRQQRELRADSRGNGRSLSAVQRHRERVDVHARRHHGGQDRRAAAAAADVRQRQVRAARRSRMRSSTPGIATRMACTRATASPAATRSAQTFCRGVQMTDSTGLVRFTTIYPGWYSGRITHVHFRVYLGNSLQATSQLAFPQDITQAVYASSLVRGARSEHVRHQLQRRQRVLRRRAVSAVHDHARTRRPAATTRR